MHEYVGVRFDGSISFFLRPNYFIFIGYFKGGGSSSEPSESHLDPPLNELVFRIHRLLHGILRLLTLFIEEFFLIFIKLTVMCTISGKRRS